MRSDLCRVTNGVDAAHIGIIDCVPHCQPVARRTLAVAHRVTVTGRDAPRAWRQWTGVE